MDTISHDENENSLYSLRGKVFFKLQNDILNGKYKAGDSLIETKLSEDMGVSRTPIREAIRQLELEGLVRTVPNKGAVVKGITKKDIEDIYTIRMMIEGLAAKWAAENITEEELDELKETVELERFYTEKEDTAHILQFDSKFHEIIFRASKSQPLMHTLSNFHHYVRRARNASLSMPGRALEALKEHRLILKAIEERKTEIAEKLTVQHIKNASKSVLKCEKEKF